jgi:hypothetical protein
MKRLLRDHGFLKSCCTKCAKTRKCRIRKASARQIKTLCECAFNVYKGNVELPKSTVNRLRPYRKELKDLSFRKLRLAKKKRILQKGGFLPILAQIAAAIASSLLL